MTIGVLTKQQGPPSDGEKTASEHKETRPTKRTTPDHTTCGHLLHLLRVRPFFIMDSTYFSFSFSQVCICNSEIPPSFPLKLAFNLCFVLCLEREGCEREIAKGITRPFFSSFGITFYLPFCEVNLLLLISLPQLAS